MRAAGLVLAWIARLLLAAFFCFVGYWKALGPMAALAEHRAWVAGFPEPLARTVGWSEILLGLLLLVVAVPRLRKASWWAAILLMVNQLIATAFHVARGEFDAVPQNVVLVALLALLVITEMRRKET